MALPALNPQSGDFWVFLILLLVVYMASSLITMGGVRVQRGDVTEVPRALKANCKVPLILAAVILAVLSGGQPDLCPHFPRQGLLQPVGCPGRRLHPGCGRNLLQRDPDAGQGLQRPAGPQSLGRSGL